MSEVTVASQVVPRGLTDRVNDALDALAGAGVWLRGVGARGAGRHVLLGFGGDDAFARITPIGRGSFGLAFRGGIDRRWEVLLVDDLRSVVEYALVGASDGAASASP